MENRCKKCKRTVGETGGLSSQGGYNFGVDYYCRKHEPWNKDYWWLNYVAIFFAGLSIGLMF